MRTLHFLLIVSLDRTKLRELIDYSILYSAATRATFARKRSIARVNLYNGTYRY